MFYWDKKPKWYNSKTMINDLGELFNQIDEHYHRGYINQEELDSLNNIRSKITHTFMTMPDFEEFLNRYFELLPVEQAEDYRFSKDTMIFFYGKVKK